MKISLHSISLPFEDFLLLLETRGLSISDDSALAPLRSFKPATDTGRLEQSGALETDPTWLEALNAICSPAYQVDTATFLGQSTMTTTYFVGAKSETLVACTPQNGSIRIIFPFAPEEVVQKELQLFGAGGGTMVDSPFSITLSPDALFLMGAGLDALREVLIASMAERLEVPQIKLPVSAFETLFRSSLDDPRADARWMATLLRLAVPARFIPRHQTLNPDALDELVDNGLILSADNSQWTPTHRYFAMANDLFLQLPALMINTRQTGGETTCALHFNGRYGLSTMEFLTKGETATARYKTTTREELWFSLETAFATPLPETKQEDQPSGSRFCTGCGNPLEQWAKFCTNCGEKVTG